MAIKLGTENKRNVIIAGVLFCLLAYLAIDELKGPSTPSAPAPAATSARSVASRPATGGNTSASRGGPGTGQSAGSGAGATGPAAQKLAGANLNPALHLDRLALSESIEYAGSGRNIFSAESAPVVIETALGNARPGVPVVPVYTPPPVPTAPPIDLKFFGYSAAKDGKREAFLLRGDDIFEAKAGEIVSNRYKVVAVDARSVQITDLSYNNTQTLPLLAN